MPYGSVLTDEVQSSTANTPPTFKDGNGTQVGTLCRAWVNFNGVTTATIRGSFNVSSVTRSGTGNYLINFTNSLSDANYAATSNATNGTGIGVDDVRAFTSTPSGSFSTSSFRVGVVNTASSAFIDASVVTVSIFR